MYRTKQWLSWCHYCIDPWFPWAWSSTQVWILPPPLQQKRRRSQQGWWRQLKEWKRFPHMPWVCEQGFSAWKGNLHGRPGARAWRGLGNRARGNRDRMIIAPPSLRPRIQPVYQAPASNKKGWFLVQCLLIIFFLSPSHWSEILLFWNPVTLEHSTASQRIAVAQYRNDTQVSAPPLTTGCWAWIKIPSVIFPLRNF